MTDKEQLDVLWLAAELTVSMGGTLVADLPKRIRSGVGGDRGAKAQPSLRSYERWLEILMAC